MGCSKAEVHHGVESCVGKLVEVFADFLKPDAAVEKALAGVNLHGMISLRNIKSPIDGVGRHPTCEVK